MAGDDEPKGFKPYGKPPAFDFDDYKDTFEVWKTKWDIFLTLSTINTSLPVAERPKYKAQTLLSCLSNSTLQAILSMGYSEDDLSNHETIITRLKERCNAGRNCNVWRHKFATSKQRNNQAIDDWLCELHDLARKCDFTKDCCNKCENTRILGQLIFGIQSDDVRVDLLKEGAELTLDLAVIAVKATEAANKQSTNLKDGSAVSLQQLKKSTYKKGKGNRPGAKPDDQPGPSKLPAYTPEGGCNGCGARKPCEKGKCPARDKECRRCGKKNHYEKVCRSKPHVEGITAGKPVVSSVTTEERVQLGITPDQADVKMSLLSALPDSGSQIDAIPTKLFKKQFCGILLRWDVQPFTAVGTPIKSNGSFKATLYWRPRGMQQRSVSTTVHVLENLHQPVISKATQLKLGMLPEGYPHSSHFSAEKTGSQANEPFVNLLARQVPPALAIRAINVTPTAEVKKADMEILMTEFQTTFDWRMPTHGQPAMPLHAEGWCSSSCHAWISTRCGPPHATPQN